MAHPPRLAACLAAAVVILALAYGTPPVQACSICRCGDPTFNALGKDGFDAHGFRVALDWERFDKDEGDPAEEASRRWRTASPPSSRTASATGSA